MAERFASVSEDENDTRRFRIKFSKSSDRSGFDNCSQFVSKIKSHIPVEEIPAGNTESDSQTQTDESQQTTDPTAQHVCRPTTAHSTHAASGNISARMMTSTSSSGLTLSDLATKCMSSEINRSGPQMSEHTSPPKDRLSLMIRLCLTDANFPAFVEAVENELLNLTS